MQVIKDNNSLEGVIIIKDNKSLEAAIYHLENVNKSDWILLKRHFEFTVTNLNPVNIVKEKISDTFSSPIFKNEIVKGALGLATVFLSNKLLLGPAPSIAKRILSTLIQTGISKVSLHKPKSFKESGIALAKNLLTKMRIES